MSLATAARLPVERRTVDLAAFPDLIVVYLGVRVNAWRGLRRLASLGAGIQGSVANVPEGLLLHERIAYSFFPVHIGMRQYWSDYESLERFTRSEAHRTWWREFLKDAGGTGFWHETYALRGGVEAIYDDIPERIGFARFAPVVPVDSARATARLRLGSSRKDAAPVNGRRDAAGSSQA